VEELNTVKEDRNILHKVQGRLTRLVISCTGTAFYNTLKEKQKDRNDGKIRKKT